eukprot:764898-Hanusia_phi.AAC.16
MHPRRQVKPGKYLKTVFVRIEGQAMPIAIPIHDGEVADLIAASFFRKYELPFDESYIPVHNTLAAVLKGQEEPADISRSNVDPQIAAQVAEHPFVKSSEEKRNVMLELEIIFEREGKTPKHITLQVREGDTPQDVLARHEEAADLSEAERDYAAKHVADKMVDKLLLEESKIAELRRGDVLDRMFEEEDLASNPLRSPLRHDPNPPWRRTDPDNLRDQDRAQEMLFHLQHPSSCTDRNLVVFSMDRAIWGLAVNVHFLTLLLNFCWRHNRTLPYLDKAARLAGRQQEQLHFFISTDDPGVLEEAQARSLDALWDKEEARYNGTHIFSPPGVSEKKWPGFPGNDDRVDTLRLPLD